MDIIIDKIRLHAPEHAEAFIQWVQQVDYASCPDLPSVLRFDVVRAAPESGCDFFEIIQVESLAAFQRDMQTPVFARLVARFSELASVTESFSGAALPPGFQRHA
ncbi:hypothetical protein RQP53_00395 [Paucibacter sp. APW11]|uniref:RedY protein n=1 Tax=Roseateles aquae TaxID=3077235 RepID=A0ABU3P580_9BURK|nr:hypothetical protein [Paucibacter sp. APW11]MDT8997727.1 hypothetical protein [Paucibacter sp. APW11]